MNELALFAGAGGGILGGHLLGWKTVAAVEIEEYPRAVLLQRQLDGILPRFPIWDDIRTFDGKPWRGKVDIITGGFPCQDISAAGKGAGLEGERSGLWSEMARIIGEVRPRFALVENSPMLTGRGLDRVLMDLAEIGYDAIWTVLGADDAGAPHRRKRIWILAYMANTRCEHGEQRNSAGMDSKTEIRADSTVHHKPSSQGCIEWWDTDPADICDASESRFQDRAIEKVGRSEQDEKPERPACNGELRPIESRLGRVVNGVAPDVDTNIKLGYNNSYEREQLSKTGPEKNEEREDVPSVWRDRESSTGPSQRQRQDEQFRGKSFESLPKMSQRDSRKSWGLGAWRNAIERGEVQDLREIVYSDTLSRNQKEFLVWFGAMHGGARTAECFEALGESPRVATGIKNRVDRLKAIGNGQVPAVSAIAFLTLLNKIKETM